MGDQLTEWSSKAHMDQVLAQTKIEVPPSSKIWEPQRAYEKKLSSIMAKGKGTYYMLEIGFLTYLLY